MDQRLHQRGAEVFQCRLGETDKAGIAVYSREETGEPPKGKQFATTIIGVRFRGSGASARVHDKKMCQIVSNKMVYVYDVGFGRQQ